MKELVCSLCRPGIFMLIITITPMFLTSAFSYSGGFFDDGLYDDDWYFDYYEQPADSDRSSQQRLREYEADQMYEEAEESGMFNF